MAFDNLPIQEPMNARAELYAVTSLALSRLAQQSTRHVLDVAYGDHAAQKLDIYLPRQEGLRDLPVLINIHGGGWSHGHKEWMAFGAPPIVALPAVYVSVNYRLTPSGHRHPAQMQDCLAALAWVHRNIGKHGGNPERIFVAGHSAGGHLCAAITLRHDLYAAHKLPQGVVKGCLPYSGVYNMNDRDATGMSVAIPSATKLTANEAERRDASPIEFVAGNRVPFFVTWSENDNPTCKAQGPIFAAALKGQPGRVEGHEFPLFDHFWIHLDQQRADAPWVRTARAWMSGDPATAPVYKV